MNQITGNWACEWGKDGIRVNCVTPWVSARAKSHFVGTNWNLNKIETTSLILVHQHRARKTGPQGQEIPQISFGANSNGTSR